ncbi:MAG: vWA domain-containing protein [Dehalococcoidia bacterium]
MDHGANGHRIDGNGALQAGVTLEAHPERRRIRPSECWRHIDFRIGVEQLAAGTAAERAAVRLALVIDRSGSMQGRKLETAKRAALAAIEKLDQRDQVALVVFDDQIDVLQPLTRVVSGMQARLRALLETVTARSSTALHEGWLTGCQQIAAEPGTAAGDLARCFLLTDGLANVGLTDAEAIASQAAGIWDRGVSTSTFGIGPDYDEGLLGPLANAGGGQFHHLRSPEEIARTFVGELGGLLAVGAAHVRMEIEASDGVSLELISKYDSKSLGAAVNAWSVTIGDLMRGEERHVVSRFRFPSSPHEYNAVRARVLWTANGEERASEWQGIDFVVALHDACDMEPRDPSVMHWVGLHHMDRALLKAASLSRPGSLEEARGNLRAVARRISEYAGSDVELQAAVQELRREERKLAEGLPSSMQLKESSSRAYRSMKGQTDYRE